MDENEVSEVRRRQIEFLIERELGLPGEAYFENQTSDEFYAEDVEDVAGARNARWDELAALSNADLTTAYERERTILEDDWLKISKPLRPEDAARWMDADGWSVAEAVALSFGIAPRINDNLLTWVQRNRRIHSGAQQVADRFWYISRAIDVGILSQTVPPRAFLEWLSSKSFGVPSVIRSFGDESPSSNDELASALRASNSELMLLRAEVDSLKKKLHEKPSLSEGTLYGLLAVMAIGPYRSELAKKRSRVPRNLSDALLLNGIELGPKRVRHHLVRAVSCLLKPNRIAIPEDDAADDEPPGTDVR
ncbi:MAG: hypothetical protein K2Y56_01190 [Methylobacterium sp.]|uniref:hypothetical protein n=1 Tax=Methylobacterium sp. TaxID=409 RepID=UPI0025DA0C45|nr:hypothetical protein [Methylobacterium sp.]MBX9930148.1 hypothetical protein [Methylobacterium sp.]